MNRWKVTLLVLLPIGLILGLSLILYSCHELSVGIDVVRKDLLDQVIRHSHDIGMNTRDQARQAEVLASLMNDPTIQVSSFIEQTIRENSMISAVQVAFDPAFLSEVKNGERSTGVRLESIFGLEPFAAHSDRYCPILIQDKNGNLGREDRASDSYVYTDWYITARELGKGSWSDPFYSFPLNGQVCIYSVPIYRQHKFIGVLSLFMEISTIVSASEVEASYDDTNYDEKLFMIADNGKIIYESNDNTTTNLGIYSLAESRGRQDIFDQLDSLLSGLCDSIRIENWSIDVNGDPHKTTWFVFAPLRNGMDYVLVSTFDEAKVLHALYYRIFSIVVAGFMTMFLLLITVYAILIQITAPITELPRIARRVSEGHLDEKVDEVFANSKSETSDLVRTFNHMIDTMSENIRRTVVGETERNLREREMMIAYDIQKSFMPHGYPFFKNIREFTLDATIIPAKFVAGDFFDFWLVNDGLLAFMIADVSGKGVPAAMFMIATRTLIRKAAESSRSTAEILTQVNRDLQDGNINGMFVTLFLGFYEFKTGKIRFTNAGHNPPIVVHRNGVADWFSYAKDPVLGVFRTAPYTMEEYTLKPDEFLFLYTDGVTEASSIVKDSDVFGNYRLLSLLGQLAYQRADKILGMVVNNLREFTGSVQRDDITLLLLKRNNLDDRVLEHPSSFVEPLTLDKPLPTIEPAPRNRPAFHNEPETPRDPWSTGKSSSPNNPKPNDPKKPTTPKPTPQEPAVPKHGNDAGKE